MIAVVICAVKMSTARVASYVVLMDANWTALTLVSDETSSLLNRDLKIQRRARQRERQKNNRFN